MLIFVLTISQYSSSLSFSLQTLSEQLTDKELEEGRLYPPLSNIREVSLQMAVKVNAKKPQKILLKKWLLVISTVFFSYAIL